MIVAQITVFKHNGCWASDTSTLFPTIKFLLFLHYIDADHFEAGLKLIPQNEESNKLIPDVLLRISGHPTWRGTSPEIDKNLFLITIRDKGKTEGIIRSILYESGTFFPMYQAMIIDKGKETLYAVFKDKKALAHVESELTVKYGKRNVEVTTLRENCKEEEIVNIIPTWYEYCVEKPFADLIKESIEAASIGVKLEHSKVEQLKDYLVNHPELMALFLDNLSKLYDYLRRLLGGS